MRANIPAGALLIKTIRDYIRLFGLRGLQVALRRGLSRGVTEVEVTPPESSHRLRLRLRTSDISAFQQIFLDEEYALDLPVSPRYIIDAGANIGLTSIYFANRFPKARIFSLEPEESNYALLESNVKSLPGVVPMKMALWKEESPVSLVDPGLGHWGFQTQDEGSRSRGSFLGSVQGITVESLMRQQSIDRIDILKMDIEGSEKEVFETSKPWIDKVGVLIVELHDQFRPGCSQSFDEATGMFEREWTQGGSVFRARRDFLPTETSGLL